MPMLIQGRLLQQLRPQQRVHQGECVVTGQAPLTSPEQQGQVVVPLPRLPCMPGLRSHASSHAAMREVQLPRHGEHVTCPSQVGRCH